MPGSKLHLKSPSLCVIGGALNEVVARDICRARRVRQHGSPTRAQRKTAKKKLRRSTTIRKKFLNLSSLSIATVGGHGGCSCNSAPLFRNIFRAQHSFLTDFGINGPEWLIIFQVTAAIPLPYLSCLNNNLVVSSKGEVLIKNSLRRRIHSAELPISTIPKSSERIITTKVYMPTVRLHKVLSVNPRYKTISSQRQPAFSDKDSRLKTVVLANGALQSEVVSSARHE